MYIYVVLLRKKQHLTILVYVSYFLCVYCAQCDVCCCMKTKTIVPNVLGVSVNFKIRTFHGRTAQLSDISSGAACVDDLDSGAQALTKEASGNSREVCVCV